ncbi:MAG: hypothetical protein ACON5B_13420 [Myxococcota bacterium]
MDIVVDEMGNVWSSDDVERKRPVMPHPELEGSAATCDCCDGYKFRMKVGNNRFEWRCGAGKVFEGFHH